MWINYLLQIILSKINILRMVDTDKTPELTEEELRAFEWALTLPEDMAEATDFEAEEAINIDYSVKLPDFFSLWEWIYKTSNQGSLWSCTSMWTTHWTQILMVKKGWVKPTNSNIVTPDWKDLWSKMGHSTTKYDGWDYVETAVKTALKQWIRTIEKWDEVKFDWYATSAWDMTDKCIDTMKRYLYQWCPIVRCVRWDKNTWTQMTKWEVKTVPTTPTGWHCIALVGWDANWFWFINSWSANDDKKLKSRFHISYKVMKDFGLKFNYRYWVLYVKEDAKKDPEYLKRKNIALIVLQVLKKQYNWEPADVQKAIVSLSQALRKAYPEINEDLPL